MELEGLGDLVTTSGRQMVVDTQGAVPDKGSRSPFLYVSHRVRSQEHLQGSINTVHCLESQGTGRWPLPPVCLPSVYLMSLHVTKSPRPSPSVFVCCKQSNTGGGNNLGTRLEFLSSRWLPLVTSEVFGSIHVTYVCVDWDKL